MWILNISKIDTAVLKILKSEQSFAGRLPKRWPRPERSQRQRTHLNVCHSLNDSKRLYIHLIYIHLNGLQGGYFDESAFAASFLFGCLQITWHMKSDTPILGSNALPLDFPERKRKMMRSKGRPLRKACTLSLIFLVFVAGFTPRPALALTSPQGLAELVDRAGGLRVLLGSSAVGALAGGLTLTTLPIVSSFGIPIGAVGGAWCAQLPDDGTNAGKAGQVCRALGHAATIFLKEFQSEYQKQSA